MTTPVPDVRNETIVETYDRFAGLYDRILTPLKTGTRQHALASLDIGGGETIVEVGCGPGHALVALARAVGSRGRVVGIDAAPGMVARARRRSRRADTPAPIDVLSGDARALPMQSGSVDIAFVEDTLELFREAGLAAVIDELNRVLDPDGQLCVLTMERAGAEDNLFVRVYDWLFEHVPGSQRFGCRPIYACQALEAGGFSVERRSRHSRGYVWPVEVVLARPE